MAFDVSALSAWVAAPSDILSKAVAGAPTYKYVRKEVGVTGSKYISTNYSTIVVNAGGCSTGDGFNPSGSTVEGQVTANSSLLSFQEFFCLSAFKDKASAHFIATGKMADSSDLAFVNSLMDEKMASLANVQETIAWQGNTASGIGNLARTNGYLYYLLHTSSSASTVAMTSAVTESNVIETVKSIIRLAPVAILKQKLIIYTTTANYQNYVNAQIALNNFHYTADSGDWTIAIPGYKNITMVATDGLDSNADGVDFVMTYGDNFTWNMDGQDEKDSVDILYNPFKRRVELNVEWFQGHTVIFPEFVVVVK